MIVLIIYLLSFHSILHSQTTTAVVVTQPAAVTVTHNQEVDYSGKAMVALVLAIIGLIFCGESLILLVCLVPALILAIIVSGSYWHHKNHTYLVMKSTKYIQNCTSIKMYIHKKFSTNEHLLFMGNKYVFVYTVYTTCKKSE